MREGSGPLGLIDSPLARVSGLHYEFVQSDWISQLSQCLLLVSINGFGFQATSVAFLCCVHRLERNNWSIKSTVWPLRWVTFSQLLLNSPVIAFHSAVCRWLALLCDWLSSSSGCQVLKKASPLQKQLLIHRLAEWKDQSQYILINEEFKAALILHIILS